MRSLVGRSHDRFKPNSVRGVSVHFGEDVLHSTMAQLGVKLIVRGHQMMMNGFNFFGTDKLVTVFTAASYHPDKPNRGATMEIDRTGSIRFHFIAPGDQKDFTDEHGDANQLDIGYHVSSEEKKMTGGGPHI
ncbi:hypothetical protein PRIPAC_71501 [Pristionchus pacificus]|uniref:Uncharacterized protein n=1 Tax=Pristionchus pacificus TaxID=54126 RepID=A0A2A6C5J5_PRIPA|nr:hypothetical protein PRIPAC_71501 [Pristionchus pacificus]|eukprot:PDM73323.1 hypothetical protein PRIPAC_40679 [Pristionchus pacificus]